MKLNEAIEMLKPFKRQVPVDALQVLRDNWVEAEPLLLAELDRCIENTLCADESALFLYALYLCAEMRSEAAFGRYVRMCRMPYFLQDHLLDDAICESMGGLLLHTCAGRFDVLKSVIEDATLNEFARSAALEALTHLAVDGDFSREEAEAYCIDLLSHKLEQQSSFVWNQVVTMALILRVQRAAKLIEWVYDVGLADSEFDSVGDVQKSLREGDFDNERRGIGSTEENIRMYASHWEEEWAGVPSEAELLAEPKKIMRRSRVAQGKGPGRNEPCPCGSGKKYKKCCISVGLMTELDAEVDIQPVAKNKADEWIAAGYFYQEEGDPRKTFFCWRNAWKEAVQILPPDCKDPDDEACDELFVGCEYFSGWLQDYLLFLEKHVSWGLEMLLDGQVYVQEVLNRFPEMEINFWAYFEQARIKFLLWTGETEKAFAELEMLKAESDYPVVWLEFESSLFGWDIREYNLKTDFNRVLHLLEEAREQESCVKSKALFAKKIMKVKGLLKALEECQKIRIEVAETARI